MDGKVGLFIIICSIMSILLAIFGNVTDYSNNATSIQNLEFIVLFYFVILKTISMFAIICRYMYTTRSIICTFIFIMYLMILVVQIIIMYQPIYHCIHKIDGFSCTICIFTSLLLLKICNYFAKEKGNAWDISKMHGLDCGSFMAYSYYYGYLKIILPSTGCLNKGIIEKIENIEDTHNIKIAVHKLFILIPWSSYIPTDLKEASYGQMESAMDLEDEIRNRAGVKRRSYHNCVYKIYPTELGDPSTYVVVEGATPLLTFFEVQKHAHQETNVYKKYCKAIIQQYYRKLKILIDNDPECADLCELIYYNDYNSNGIKTNVAHIILKRVFEIQNRN